MTDSAPLMPAPPEGPVGAPTAPTEAPFVSSVSASPRDAWHDPRPLKDALPPVDVFAPDLLPDSLRPWILDVAERTQAPIEYVAVSAMVALGAAVGRRVGARPRRLDDWQEYPNLWGMVIGPPSWMKSPAVEEGKRPLAMLADRALDGFENAHRQWEAEAEAAKARHEGARARARRSAANGVEIDSKELIKPAIREQPRPPRLIVNDATVPAVVEVLRENPNGVLVYRDELAAFIAELDREGMEGSRGFYLSAWSGKESYTQDRILRGTNLRVRHACVSMLGGIQPARIAPLLRDSLATGGADGFLARFSLAVWPDSPGDYRAIDRRPNETAFREAYAVYERLYALRPETAGAESGDGSAPFLRFDGAAAEVFAGWDVELRNRLRSGVEDPALVPHLLKYPKMVCALALLCHLTDGATGPISHHAVTCALAWAKVLESHARRIYSSLGQVHVDAAQSLRRHLNRGDLPAPFTLRDVYRNEWARLTNREAAQAAVDVLEARGWLRSEQIDTGGRPTVLYYAHPAALRRLHS
jgi:uncharacterized protein DUF3987